MVEGVEEVGARSAAGTAIAGVAGQRPGAAIEVGRDTITDTRRTVAPVTAVTAITAGAAVADEESTAAPRPTDTGRTAKHTRAVAAIGEGAIGTGDAVAPGPASAAVAEQPARRITTGTARAGPRRPGVGSFATGAAVTTIAHNGAAGSTVACCRTNRGHTDASVTAGTTVTEQAGRSTVTAGHTGIGAGVVARPAVTEPQAAIATVGIRGGTGGSITDQIDTGELVDGVVDGFTE